jgi:hypothetical protein
MHCSLRYACGGPANDDNRTARARGHHPDGRSPYCDRLAIPDIRLAANALILGLVLILLVAKEACSIRLRARCGERCGVVAVTKSACILQFQQAPT